MAEAKPVQLTPEQQAMVDKILGGQTGTGAISAPQGTQNVVIKNDKFDASKPVTPDNYPIISVPSPNSAPTPTQKTAYGSADTGWYVIDDKSPNGVKLIVPPHTPNADDEINKALDRDKNENLRNERQANSAAGNGYMTNAELADLQLKAKQQGVSEADLKEKIRQFDLDMGQKQKEFDRTQAEKEKVDAANIGLTTAQTKGQEATTQRTGAETKQIETGTQRTSTLLPGEVSQQGATLEGTRASTAGTEATTAQTKQATQIAAQPTMSGVPGASPVITTRNPLTGEVNQSQMDLAYQPKTQAEIAARVGQINSAMTSMSQRVQAKVGTMVNGKQYTADDALKEFNDWYGAQVAPQQDALKAAQDEAAFQRGKEQATMRTAAQGAANTYGSGLNTAFNNMVAAKPVGNQAATQAAAAQLAQGKVPDNLKDLTWTGPNPMAAYAAGVAQALKYLDPAAAQAAGAPPPNYQQMDISAMTRNPYAAPGVGATMQNMPANGRGGATMQNMPATGQGGATMQNMQANQQTGLQSTDPDWFKNLMTRQQQDVNEQRIQASAMPMKTPPGMYNPAFQAMNGSAVGQPANAAASPNLDTSPTLPPAMQPQAGEDIDSWRRRVMGGISNMNYAPGALQTA